MIQPLPERHRFQFRANRLGRRLGQDIASQPCHFSPVCSVELPRSQRRLLGQLILELVSSLKVCFVRINLRLKRLGVFAWQDGSLRRQPMLHRVEPRPVARRLTILRADHTLRAHKITLTLWGNNASISIAPFHDRNTPLPTDTIHQYGVYSRTRNHYPVCGGINNRQSPRIRRDHKNPREQRR